jgi:hypothetical protein
MGENSGHAPDDLPCDDGRVLPGGLVCSPHRQGWKATRG